MEIPDVYAPPANPTPPVRGQDEIKRLRDRSLICLAIGVCGPIPFFFLGAATDSRIVLGLGTAITPIAAVIGVLAAIRLVLARSAAGTAVGLGVAGDVVLVLVHLGMGAFGALATLAATFAFSRGRQIRARGATLLPPVGRGADWLTVAVGDVPVPDEARTALASQWRENGRTEHASVAAFARLTLDLVALGAPPALVAGAQRDALDEIRHAELCFSLARALDGEEASPVAFPDARAGLGTQRSRVVALADLAVSSLVDGALNEGVSARIVARLAKRCEDPTLRAILREIAADEGRHAAHGWDVVRFCLAEGGAPVAHALAGAARSLPRRLVSTLAPASRDGSWQRWGIPGEALEAEELARARADVTRRVAALVACYDVAIADAA